MKIGEDIKMFTARRAYEFRQDELRLTLITLEQVRAILKRAFNFEVVAIGNPLPTFGAVANSIPPGLACDYGSIPFPDGEITPIRFVHFEPQRLVIDVAGSSESIDEVYRSIREILRELRSPDGVPAIGEPHRIRDFTALTMRIPIELDTVLNPKLAEIARRILDPNEQANSSALIPQLRISLSQPDGMFAPEADSENTSYQFELRVGTNVEDKVFFSAAPLDSDTHKKYVREIAASLLSPRKDNKRRKAE